jgi:hypothetical protein
MNRSLTRVATAAFLVLLTFGGSAQAQTRIKFTLDWRF